MWTDKLAHNIFDELETPLTVDRIYVLRRKKNGPTLFIIETAKFAWIPYEVEKYIILRNGQIYW